MLKSWSVENFKAIVNSGDLQLAPVTVLAGLNSSGKSSLLQSILMISQTLSNRVLDRALLPNGPIVQLGTFQDILNDTTEIRTLAVKFNFEFDESDEINVPDEFSDFRTGITRRILINTSIIDINTKNIEANIYFRSASDNNNITSAIEASQVIVDRVMLKTTLNSYEPSFIKEDGIPKYAERNIQIVLNVVKALDKLLEKFLSNVETTSMHSLPPAFNAQSGYLGTMRSNIERGGKEEYLIALSHFLPSLFFRKFKMERRIRKQLVDIIAAVFEHPYSNANSLLSEELIDLLDFNETMPEELTKYVYDLCYNEVFLMTFSIHSSFSGHSIHDLANWLKNLKVGREKSRKKGLLAKKIQEIIVQHYTQKWLAEKQYSKDTEGLVPIYNNRDFACISFAVDYITRFFTSKIRYLGPLRADPQASQKFSPSSELDDVGTKGEYAGAVYDANQRLMIDWYNPYTQQVEKDTLRVALDNWAHYLGVAERIQIETAGQSGVSWQVVHAQGHRPLPLSAVGVGVSQVLPILVMGLLAPKDTLLLVEQPELHLHPRVQARLGDFFMGLAKCSKQCLIETHSENLISQLRYHIVAAGGQQQSDCKIYFVEQDQQGAARFDPIEISPEGNILNWPEGFFDETMLQEDRITALSVKKRAAKQKTKTEKQA